MYTAFNIYYSASEFSSPPSSNADLAYEPIDEFVQDPNYSLPRNIPTHHSAKIRRVDMLKAKNKHAVSDSSMSIKQALNHPCATGFIYAFAAEVQSLKDMRTFTEFFGKPNDVEKGSLLSSKVIFPIVYNPEETFKKYKACLVARGDILKNIYDPDTYWRELST
jgi:hypothetical protein